MACNKCKQEDCHCASNTCDPIDASCVIYNSDGSPSDLTCIEDIAPKTSLKTILEKWDQYFCDLSNVFILSCVKSKLNIPQETDSLSPNALLNYIQQWICTYQDVNVKVSPSDTSSGFLTDKIELGECLTQSVVKDSNGKQKYKISLDWPCITAKLPLCFQIKSPECIVIDNTNAPCVPLPTVPVIVKNGLTLSGTNCNGSIQWYNTNNVLVGSGNVIQVPSNEIYYAKCATTCGESIASLPVTVPPVNTYTKMRSAIFQKECGTNECSVPCIGTFITFSKTYTSFLSQDNANSLAENDQTFALEGQAKVNAEGSCTCPDCNCVFPGYNPSVVVSNATCTGNAITANGQILIGGIVNANRFGFYVGQGGYNGVGYSAAFSLNNFNQGNIETTPSTVKIKALSTETRVVVRLFNGAENCFTDIVVNLTPPDCSKETIDIENITVSCEIITPECINYNIVAGGSGGTVWYTDCSLNKYVYSNLTANQTVQRCSKSVPVATGAVVTANGNCV